MIEDHIQQLRDKLAEASGLPEGTRAELLELVEALEREAAQGEAGQTEETEAPALGKLVNSVEELEASHPELVASINQVASVLGKMGI